MRKMNLKTKIKQENKKEVLYSRWLDALNSKSKEKILRIIQKGQDVNASLPNGYYKGTALTFLAGQGDFSLVEILVNNGADGGATDQFGHTPLSWACCIGDEKTALFLISKFPEFVKQKNNKGDSPIYLYFYHRDDIDDIDEKLVATYMEFIYDQNTGISSYLSEDPVLKKFLEEPDNSDVAEIWNNCLRKIESGKRIFNVYKQTKEKDADCSDDVNTVEIFRR